MNDADHSYLFDTLLGVLVILVLAACLVGCRSDKPRYEKVFHGNQSYSGQQWHDTHPTEQY